VLAVVREIFIRHYGEERAVHLAQAQAIDLDGSGRVRAANALGIALGDLIGTGDQGADPDRPARLERGFLVEQNAPGAGIHDQP